jgi:hypothetical protein
MKTLLLLTLLIGCSDPYGEAQTADTIEAYETFISANPSSPRLDMAGMRLEGLYLEKARQDKKLQSYDEYLAKYPKGSMLKKAMAERQKLLIRWAETENTAAAWKTVLDDYPKARSPLKRRVRERMHMAKQQSKIVIGEVKMERINMANDPQGPLNGYGFWVEVTNEAKRAITRLDLEIAYLGPTGRTLATKRWEVVHPGPLHSDHTPMAEGFSAPMKSGKTRTWEWSDSAPPEAWAKKVSITPVHIVFKKKD